jgi:hypothetical protein
MFWKDDLEYSERIILNVLEGGFRMYEKEDLECCGRRF